ncbi:MAG: sulfatase [Cyclobacteriaceae bacterium]
MLKIFMMMIRWHRKLFLAFVFLPSIFHIVSAQSQRAEDRMNVLFIAIDDLRPELGSYGKSYIYSPNIDGLASEGLLFERAYCQQAVCSPSRTSLLTGLRPDATGVYNLTTHFRKTTPDVVTLPQYFKENGYHTQWWGKIYHAALLDSISWSVDSPPYEPGSNWRGYVLEESKKIAGEHNGNGPAFEKADLPDNAYPDGKIADGAVASLQKLALGGKPFFLAVGFLKPHLPFNAPKKYWDLYDPSAIVLPAHQSPPDHAPAFAGHNSGELRAYHGIPDKGLLTREQSVQLIHGYRACVSYTDAQVGRLLTELKRTGLDKNTIVILWGDHGWKLGDYGMWAKHTNFEVDTHAPLILRVPRMRNRGSRTPALVEFIDIYPSLCELAGLAIPGRLPGRSFVPLIDDPQLPWKNAAFSQYPRGDMMGYSMRTDQYRFTKWRKKGQPSEIVAYELYDLRSDPHGFVNIAPQAESKKVIERLSRIMRDAGIGEQPIP